MAPKHLVTNRVTNLINIQHSSFTLYLLIITITTHNFKLNVVILM